jgi:hypothetical protein
MTFDGTPVYRDGQTVGSAEVAQRRDTWWRPYHDQLRSELDRIRAQHGVAMLWDAHSIRSVLPRFFEGKLPDFNIGTARGTSCRPDLGERIHQLARGIPGHTAVLNGRYTGGYITRHYGEPAAGFNAVQLELTQCSYIQERWPFDYLRRRTQFSRTWPACFERPWNLRQGDAERLSRSRMSASGRKQPSWERRIASVCHRHVLGRKVSPDGAVDQPNALRPAYLRLNIGCSRATILLSSTQPLVGALEKA